MPHINSRKPCYFAKFPDRPQTCTLNVIWLQKRIPDKRVWVKPNFTLTKNVGRSSILCSTPPIKRTVWLPISWRNLLKVLYPIRRPVIALDCVLLKDRHINAVPRQGAKINYRDCFVVLPTLRHHTQCWLTNQRLILLLVSCLDTPKASSGTRNFTAEPSIASLLAISFPRTPAYPGTQYSFTEWRVLLL